MLDNDIDILPESTLAVKRLHLARGGEIPVDCLVAGHGLSVP